MNVLKGWKDPIDNMGPSYIDDFFANQTLQQYKTVFLLQHIEVVNETCKDPVWMGTDSFYPEGILCYFSLQEVIDVELLYFILHSTNLNQ